MKSDDEAGFEEQVGSRGLYARFIRELFEFNRLESR